MKLSQGKIGHIYLVEKIMLPVQIERRLEALGMTRLTPVTVVNTKNHGVLVVKLRGSRFALGRTITKNIWVKPVKPEASHEK